MFYAIDPSSKPGPRAPIDVSAWSEQDRQAALRAGKVEYREEHPLDFVPLLAVLSDKQLRALAKDTGVDLTDDREELILRLAKAKRDAASAPAGPNMRTLDRKWRYHRSIRDYLESLLVPSVVTKDDEARIGRVQNPDLSPSEVIQWRNDKLLRMIESKKRETIAHLATLHRHLAEYGVRVDDGRTLDACISEVCQKAGEEPTPGGDWRQDVSGKWLWFDHPAQASAG